MGKGKTELTASEMAEEAELVADISARLKHVLEERGWTVYKLINECHVSKNSVYNAYFGRAGVMVNTLNRICKTMDMEIVDFFSYQPTEDLNLSEAERIDIMNKRKLDEAAKQRVSAYIQALVDEKESKKE